MTQHTVLTRVLGSVYSAHLQAAPTVPARIADPAAHTVGGRRGNRQSYTCSACTMRVLTYNLYYTLNVRGRSRTCSACTTKASGMKLARARKLAA